MKSRIPASNPLSLLVEILDWLLAPLIILWPLSVVVTFWIANAISNIPYDRALADSVNALARHVTFNADRKGGARVALPAAASSFLRTDELDTIYFQVRGTRGEILAGDRELAEIFPEEAQAQHIVYFRDAEWHGDPVRVAYMFMFEPQAPHRRVVVQVGETLNKRKRLSNEIIAGIIIPQFFLFPVVALLAWFGLQRGTLPLERLRQRLLSRRPGDLSPINVREVPEEVAPLIEAFNGVMERLSTTMRAQERFIADAAHQMRTPLAGLRTQLEFALRQRDPADLRASLERIRSSVERATRMISQLLSLARSQSETPPKFEPVDMNALAREVTQEWVEHALAKRIDLGFEGASGPTMVEGSRLLLHELLNNLVDNAVRYTPPGGRVTARVAVDSSTRDAVSVEIEDNGVGIAEPDRELIFERFYRVGGNEVPGTGLGLPIVRSIAAQHRASVQVRPNPSERGSVFTVIFPRLHVVPQREAA
ncbi:MAG TPA: sensor histidine kinase N-terminal domain-containing protein [Burkholderiales bacterium]|nr:sensor histidine kinase N-terminal domain-containing protein [Burkholderiales bacterium]